MRHIIILIFLFFSIKTTTAVVNLDTQSSRQSNRQLSLRSEYNNLPKEGYIHFLYGAVEISRTFWLKSDLFCHNATHDRRFQMCHAPLQCLILMFILHNRTSPLPSSLYWALLGFAFLLTGDDSDPKNSGGMPKSCAAAPDDEDDGDDEDDSPVPVDDFWAADCTCWYRFVMYGTTWGEGNGIQF